jgi:hypothetical protein
VALKDKQKGNRTIVLNFTPAEYARFMDDPKQARQMIDSIYKKHPELFPSEMGMGYKLNGKTRHSRKTGIRMRKMCVGSRTYQIRPSYVLSYMRGLTDAVEKPLFLLRFGVPFWALAYVFGKNPMYWYRLFISLAEFSVVGATIHNASKAPLHLLADEYHVHIKGALCFIATTCANGCILGVEAVRSVCADALQKGYGVFKEEVQRRFPNYKPKTVNIDGWQATHNAWRALFARVFVIECFLHAYIKVRDRATKPLRALFDTAADKIWDIYRAESKRAMGQRLRRLYQWTCEHLADCPMRDNILKLYHKRKRWLAHIDFPEAYRTSNTLDRLMKFMNRHAIAAQGFHSSLDKTTRNFRAFALLYNFTPSCPMITKFWPHLKSPAARLNGFVYHPNWLQNLLIAASLGGYRQHSNPLQ